MSRICKSARFGSKGVMSLVGACLLWTVPAVQAAEEQNPPSSGVIVRAEKAGTIFVTLLEASDADKFPGGDGSMQLSARITKAGDVVIDLRHLPDGSYAISAFLDTNANGELDRNLVGMPTEPYGFSNNARGAFGPPSFQSAMFALEAGTINTPQLIRLK